MRLKRETLKEIGKRFLTVATVFLSVGLVAPLFQKHKANLFYLLLVFGFWLAFFLLGVYFVNKGSEDG